MEIVVFVWSSSSSYQYFMTLTFWRFKAFKSSAVKKARYSDGFMLTCQLVLISIIVSSADMNPWLPVTCLTPPSNHRERKL